MMMRANRTKFFGSAVVGSAALFGITSTLLAQAPTKSEPNAKAMAANAISSASYKVPNGSGILNFMTRIGSFKGLGSDEVPLQGILDMSFSGTLLVSAKAPGTTIQLTGDIRKEYVTKDSSKEVYFGTGHVVITGKWRAVQFFGKDLIAKFNGIGIFRFFGEFDRNLQTGFYWTPGSEKRAWGTSGMQAAVPNPSEEAPTPTVRIHKGG